MPVAARRAAKVNPVVTPALQKIKFAKKTTDVPVGRKKLVLNLATQKNHTRVATPAFPSPKSATKRTVPPVGTCELHLFST